jgi:molybdate transport system substrate-binding protein
MDELIATYKASDPGAQIDVTYGSSGNFLTQIKEGAPFDLYFSADIAYPQQLVEAGLAIEAPRLYAIGKIVLWVPTGSPIDVEKVGMDALNDPAAKKVAIANPEHAPYGRAAVAAMEYAGVYDQVEPRLVLGENISQAAQFVQQGGADIGVVALSLSLAPPMDTTGTAWLVPLDFYPTIEQGAVVLKAAQDPAAATRFLDFVLGTDGRAVLDTYGFQLPQ